MLLLCCISPGAGTLGSLMMRLFMRLDLLRSSPCILLGELLLGERCRPRLMVAAACSDDKGGERGEGGPPFAARNASALLLSEMRRGRGCVDDVTAGGGVAAEGGGGEAGRLLRSGGIEAVIA